MKRFRSLPIVFTLIFLGLVLLWDVSGLDLPLARWAGAPWGFPLRGNHLFVLFAHEVPRFASWAVLAVLFVAVRWPFSALRSLGRSARMQLVVSALVSVAMISVLKYGSSTSCPWDLAEFGGVARYVSHWQWGVGDGGPGKCFPAGHASAAFAYLGGWFVWRKVSLRLAAAWAAGAVALGLILGLGQQWRGAHYMSHTLWTAWICWTAGLAVEMLWRSVGALRLRSRLPASASTLEA